MKVKDLINELSRFNEDLEINISHSIFTNMETNSAVVTRIGVTDSASFVYESSCGVNIASSSYNEFLSSCIKKGA